MQLASRNLVSVRTSGSIRGARAAPTVNEVETRVALIAIKVCRKKGGCVFKTAPTL